MAKGKSTWKYNKLLTARRKYFAFGTENKSLDWSNPFKRADRKATGASLGDDSLPSDSGFLGLDWSNPFKGADGAAAKNALVKATGAAVGSIGGGLLSGGMTSTAGNVLSGLSGIADAIPGPWGAVASAGLGLASGLTNRMFGSKMNTENIAKVEANINNLNSFQSNASDFDTLSSNWANADVGVTFKDSYIGKDGWFSNKAKNKAADLRSQIEAGNAWVQNTLVNNAENIGTTQMQNLLGNYAAFGGELNTQGGDFTNGLLYIDNGGSHEVNPYEGVPLGVDPEGTLNLVEEGETVFNDYVFSKRLSVPKAIRDKYKLRSTKDFSFAEMSKELAKESEERPNDPISKRGLEALMADLANAQEGVRETQQVRQHAMGGRLFNTGGETKKSANRYYKKNSNGQYELVTGENPYLDIQNAGNYTQVRSMANDQDGTDYYYDPDEADPEYKKLPTGLRYAPAVGLGIATITDAFGLTNKPDYSNSEAILEASKGAEAYQPVRFKPVGNYLTYRPFDRDYYINKMNAEAGATRRAITNTSGGNRATAMAGILAADNDYLGQIGGLARQAEEYNLAQRAQVEEFNRGTNTTNSQGLLQADMANQKALMDSRELSLKGTMAAAEMREKARLASEQAKSANLSGFVTALGDIGRENMAWNWRNFGMSTGTFGNIGDEEGLLTHTGKKKSNKGAKGGKMKRRKGLTI